MAHLPADTRTFMIFKLLHAKLVEFYSDCLAGLAMEEAPEN